MPLHIPMRRAARLRLLAKQWQRIPVRTRHHLIGMVRAKLRVLQNEIVVSGEEDYLQEGFDVLSEFLTWTLEDE